MKTILVTGSAGFIGFHLSKKLLSEGHKVIGIDNINDYYDPKLKRDRLENLEEFVKKNKIDHKYDFFQLDISDEDKLFNIFKSHNIEIVVNLAAQAGVRYSLQNPKQYVSSNLVGFVNILECCRHFNIQHLMFASSSSVYGMNIKQPFSTTDNTDYPISLYAATKKSNELLAYSYSHLFGLPCTGLRFFTVYGPFGRPDMAYYKFTEAIIKDKPIKVFNKGDMKRDFTYIDDIIDAMKRLIDKSPPLPQSSTITKSEAPFKVFNIGNNQPISLSRFIKAIEEVLGKNAIKEFLPMQAGDVPITFADVDELRDFCGYTPDTSIEDGIERFVKWYIDRNEK